MQERMHPLTRMSAHRSANRPISPAFQKPIDEFIDGTGSRYANLGRETRS